MSEPVARKLGKAAAIFTLGSAAYLMLVRKKPLHDDEVGSVLVFGTATLLLCIGAEKLGQGV